MSSIRLSCPHPVIHPPPISPETSSDGLKRTAAISQHTTNTGCPLSKRLTTNRQARQWCPVNSLNTAVSRSSVGRGRKCPCFQIDSSRAKEKTSLDTAVYTCSRYQFAAMSSTATQLMLKSPTSPPPPPPPQQQWRADGLGSVDESHDYEHFSMSPPLPMSCCVPAPAKRQRRESSDSSLPSVSYSSMASKPPNMELTQRTAQACDRCKVSTSITNSGKERASP